MIFSKKKYEEVYNKVDVSKLIEEQLKKEMIKITNVIKIKNNTYIKEINDEKNKCILKMKEEYKRKIEEVIEETYQYLNKKKIKKTIKIWKKKCQF